MWQHLEERVYIIEVSLKRHMVEMLHFNFGFVPPEYVLGDTALRDTVLCDTEYCVTRCVDGSSRSEYPHHRPQPTHPTKSNPPPATFWQVETKFTAF